MSLQPHLVSLHGAAQRRDGQGWMVTLADLMALMLTFFVLLFSMQRIETGQWETLREAIEPTFRGMASKPAVLEPEDTPSLAGRDPARAGDAAYYARVLRSNLSGLGPGLHVAASGSAVTIALPEAILRAVLDAGDQDDAAVTALAEQLRRLGRDITLLGVADQTTEAPTAAARWTQALTRAEALSGRLRTAGVARDMPVGATGPDSVTALAGTAAVRIVIDFNGSREAQS